MDQSLVWAERGYITRIISRTYKEKTKAGEDPEVINPKTGNCIYLYEFENPLKFYLDQMYEL